MHDSEGVVALDLADAHQLAQVVGRSHLNLRMRMTVHRMWRVSVSKHALRARERAIGEAWMQPTRSTHSRRRAATEDSGRAYRSLWRLELESIHGCSHRRGGERARTLRRTRPQMHLSTDRRAVTTWLSRQVQTNTVTDACKRAKPRSIQVIPKRGMNECAHPEVCRFERVRHAIVLPVPQPQRLHEGLVLGGRHRLEVVPA